MSIWQFFACVDGWNDAQDGGGGPEAPTPEEFDAAVAAYGE